ncbi:PEP-CTERM sorting domain-containing protein [Kiritimatiellota bacterium B12222]|nr:PEP-CTERM sorting domain-containing protein [Kiritimatiellota bacterium B12222]
MKLLKLSLLSLTATLFTSSLMAGAFDITYDFTNTGDPTSVTGDVSGTTVTPVGYGGWATIGGETVQFRSNFTPSAQSDTDYIAFTLTSTTPGESLDFTSFAFSLGGRDGNANTSIVSVNLRIGETGADFSSLPDVVFMPGSVSTATHTVVGPTSNTFTDYTADLSAPAYQDMESAEVRLYYFDNTGGSNMYGAIDYISMSGASVVPEPSSIVLLLGSIAFMCAFMLKRRR